MAGLTTGKNVAVIERDRTTRNQKVPSDISRLGQEYRKLFIQQSTSDMPDDDENFPPTILWGERFDIVAVLCHWKDFAGTFECNLNIDGVDVPNTTFSSSDFSESTLSGKILTEPVPYKSTSTITVKVVNSSDIEEWEAIFYMREVL